MGKELRSEDGQDIFSVKAKENVHTGETSDCFVEQVLQWFPHHNFLFFPQK